MKQNQVRIGLGRQVLERFRSSVQIIPARQADGGNKKISNDIADLHAEVEKPKVVDHSAASSYGDGDVVAAKYRGQNDSVGKGAGGRKVTFGNPQVERASSAPSTSRIKIPESVREIHSPGNPWTN